ncbi:MAG: phospholipase D-like domain-containing protein [Sphingomonas sp.]
MAPLSGRRAFTYAGLLRKRVQIYEYQPTKLHTKLFVVDDRVYIGSANFDIRSMFLNLELMLRIDDAAFAQHVRDYVEGEARGLGGDHRGGAQRAHRPLDAAQADGGLFRDGGARL